MRSSLKWLTVILGVSAFGATSLASAKEIEWKKIDDAMSLAKSQNKHLIIDFYSPT